ncbi:MAG TPA: CBS domain-containing protein [Polyangiaceae bacterium]
MKIQVDRTVEHIMQGLALSVLEGGHPIIVATADDSLKKADDWFIRHDVHHLPVVDALESRKLIGIVSTTDLLTYYRAHPGANLAEVSVGQVMTREPETIAPHTTIADAAEILAGAKYHSLPVVDSTGRCVGIVTTRDIIKYVAEQVKAPG